MCYGCLELAGDLVMTRTAELIKEKIPADRNWLEPDSPFQEYDDYPSDPVDYTQHNDEPSGDWYHVTTQSLAPGTKLIPGGGKGLHDTSTEWGSDSGMGNRRNHVWLAPNIEKAMFWHDQLGGDEYGARIHHVKPGAKPQRWNMTGSEGWVAPHAHVLQDITDDPALAEFKTSHIHSERIGKVQFPYLRNNGGMRHVPGFDQETEPWGRYMSPDADEHHLPLQQGWERGQVDFDNPLYVPHNYGAWKQELSQAHGGLTGQALSDALLAKGHDGVVTHDKYGIGEIVDIRPKNARGHRVA